MYQIRSFIKNYPGIVPPITNYQQDLHFVSDAVFLLSWIRSRKLSRMTHNSLRSKQYNVYSGEEISDAFENLWPPVNVGNDKWNRIAEELLQLFPFNSSVKILPSPLCLCFLFFWSILLPIHCSTVYGNRRVVPLNCAG